MKIIIANWKANPTSLDEARRLFLAEIREAEKYSQLTMVCCPPVVYLEELFKELSLIGQTTIKLGAQDMGEAAGPFTGEISPEMLQNFAVKYVLIGHSDRRYTLGESDEVINRKVKAALRAAIVPVLLVGEKEPTDNRPDILAEQLGRDLEGLDFAEIAKVLITYEPVWAISTRPGAHSDTPQSALGAAKLIREIILRKWSVPSGNIKVLYGGSVNANNAADFLGHAEINGAVVGGASLRAEEFGKILKLASQ